MRHPVLVAMLGTAMAEEDIRYYQARAGQELALAQEAQDPRAAEAHFKLAGY